MSRSRSPRRCKSRHRRESASLPENGIHWRDAMDDAQEQLDQAEIESFLTTLAFVREYGINVILARRSGEPLIERQLDRDPARRGRDHVDPIFPHKRQRREKRFNLRLI